MAERSTVPVDTNTKREAITYSCSGLTFTTTDTMQPIEVPNYSDKTVQIYGTFGVGGSISIYGSSDIADLALQPDNAASGWVIMSDGTGNPITKTSKDCEVIQQNPRYLTAKVTAGDGTTNLKVLITCKRGF